LFEIAHRFICSGVSIWHRSSSKSNIAGINGSPGRVIVHITLSSTLPGYCHLSNHLAGSAPLQCGARSGHASQTDVWDRVHVCVRCIDQDTVLPVNTLEGISYLNPKRGKNDDIALGSLLFRSGNCALTEICDKISQRIRTSGIRYDYSVTSGWQMMAESSGYVAGAYKSYFHDPFPLFSGIR
jgi:hypothetical protein